MATHLVIFGAVTITQWAPSMTKMCRDGQVANLPHMFSEQLPGTALSVSSVQSIDLLSEQL
jgi:hypothetical protein